MLQYLKIMKNEIRIAMNHYYHIPQTNKNEYELTKKILYINRKFYEEVLL